MNRLFANLLPAIYEIPAIPTKIATLFRTIALPLLLLHMVTAPSTSATPIQQDIASATMWSLANPTNQTSLASPISPTNPTSQTSQTSPTSLANPTNPTTSSSPASHAPWDTPLYPERSIRIDHMDAELYLDSSGSIQGTVQLTLEILPAGTDSIQLHAAELDIQSIKVGDEAASFRFDDDRLWIYPVRPTSVGELINLEIIYEAKSNFGIHHNENGTLFTSLLPKSTRHWIPSVDLPVSEFTTDIRFIHPASQMLIASGQRISNRILTVDQEETRYRSDFPIPAPDLFFALGDFSIRPAEIDGMDFRILLIHEIDKDGTIRGLTSGELLESRVDGIASVLDEVAREMQEITGRDYPHATFQLIYMSDVMWETRHTASGMHLIDHPEPDSPAVTEAFIQQWTQTLLRPHHWSDARANHVLSAVVLRELAPTILNAPVTSDAPVTSGAPAPATSNAPVAHYSRSGLYSIPINPIEQKQENQAAHSGMPETQPAYDSFTRDELLKADNLLQRDPLFAQAIRETMPVLFQRTFPLITWEEFSQTIYAETGLSRLEPPDWTAPPIRVTERYPYVATITPDETTGRVTIRFEAEGEPLDELQTVIVTEMGYDGLNTRELEVTGAVSEWVLTVSPSTESIAFSIPAEAEMESTSSVPSRMEIREQKPLPYWIAQYDLFPDNSEQRRKALAGLRDYSDNPDIELAIRDRLETETDAYVLAEGLTTLAAVTQGAKGTEMQFLEYLAPDQAAEVQKAAIFALSNYAENQEVLRRLRVTVQRSEESGIRHEALRAMAAISDANLFRNSTERFLTDERLIDSVPLILSLLADKGDQEQARTTAATFLSSAVPAQVRLQILEWMLRTSTNPDYWEPKLGALLRDEDPRVRALAVWALNYTEPDFAREWIGTLRSEEFDARVLAELMKVAEGLTP